MSVCSAPCREAICAGTRSGRRETAGPSTSRNPIFVRVGYERAHLGITSPLVRSVHGFRPENSVVDQKPSSRTVDRRGAPPPAQWKRSPQYREVACAFTILIPRSWHMPNESEEPQINRKITVWEGISLKELSEKLGLSRPYS